MTSTAGKTQPSALHMAARMGSGAVAMLHPPPSPSPQCGSQYPRQDPQRLSPTAPGGFWGRSAQYLTPQPS